MAELSDRLLGTQVSRKQQNHRPGKSGHLQMTKVSITSLSYSVRTPHVLFACSLHDSNILFNVMQYVCFCSVMNALSATRTVTSSFVTELANTEFGTYDQH